MSLVHCKECGKEISDRALTCPHCGVPGTWTEILDGYWRRFKRVGKITAFVWAALLLAAVIFAIVYFSLFAS